MHDGLISFIDIRVRLLIKGTYVIDIKVLSPVDKETDV